MRMLGGMFPFETRVLMDITTQLWTFMPTRATAPCSWTPTCRDASRGLHVKTGLIPDPYKGPMNETRSGWSNSWTYSTTLARPQGWPAKDSLVLTFSNLDTYATVRLDGVTILTADNAHRTHCSQPFVLNKKEHELTVTLAPVAAEGQSLLEQSNLIIPASNEPKDIGFQTSPFRKPDTNLAGTGDLGSHWHHG